jgi:cytidine deaminase
VQRPTIDWAALRRAATEVMQCAYAPYSGFRVGAAGLVDDGRIVVGCNVENAAYGVVLCAECGVVSALHAGGGGRLVALSCVDGSGTLLTPCGRCRQLLWENGGPECLVEAEGGPLRMASLLPHAFDAEDLDRPAPVEMLPARVRQWHGRGTVFVHPDQVGGQQVWTAYWERSSGLANDAGYAGDAGDSHGAADAEASPGREEDERGILEEDERGILEEGPIWMSSADAIAWGRARTPRVVVVDADGTLSWAGDGDPPAVFGEAIFGGGG